MLDNNEVLPVGVEKVWMCMDCGIAGEDCECGAGKANWQYGYKCLFCGWTHDSLFEAEKCCLQEAIKERIKEESSHDDTI